MRRILLGALTGAGVAWLAWQLRGWPPAYWKLSAARSSANGKVGGVSTVGSAGRVREASSVARLHADRAPARRGARGPLFDVGELELAPLPEFGGRAAAAAGKPRPGRLALVADDDADTRTLAAQLLEGAGFEVVTAADGDEALRIAIERNPAVCVLDSMMPRRNGLDVLESLRAGEGTRATPVLLLTARAGRKDIERGMSAGADGCLTKPFTPDQLRERVLALVELRAA